MGLFYTTFTANSPDTAKIVSALKKHNRCGFVSPPTNNQTVIFEQKTEEQDFDEIEFLGKELSQACDAAVLGAVLHDDDVLYLWLFQAGEQVDFYNSLPQYFDPDAEPGPPEGGDAKIIAKAFSKEIKHERIEHLLRANLLEDELPEIAGELERHQAVINELGLPSFAAFVTYSSIDGDYLPDEFRDIEFVRVES